MGCTQLREAENCSLCPCNCVQETKEIRATRSTRSLPHSVTYSVKYSIVTKTTKEQKGEKKRKLLANFTHEKRCKHPKQEEEKS
jgi:hypothetical protein